MFLLAALPSCPPVLDTRTAVAFSSWRVVFTYRLLPVFQLSFCSRLGVQLNNTSLPFLSCLLQNQQPDFESLGPIFQATFTANGAKAEDVPGAQGIPKELQLSRAKVYTPQRKKALWVSKSDSVFHHHVPHTPRSHVCAHATRPPPRATCSLGQTPHGRNTSLICPLILPCQNVGLP